MNKQELIEYCKSLKGDLNEFINGIDVDKIIKKIEQLDEPQAGHAEEAPRYVKNILARLRELPLHDREVWLKAIMDEFEQDFSHAKWREGYEQGKFEGAWVGNQLKDADKIRQELNKPVVPQFVANWYEKNKDDFETALFNVIYVIYRKRNDNKLSKFEEWIIKECAKPFQTLANMHQFGYEVEEEKRYLIKVKNVLTRQGALNRNKKSGRFIFSNPEENSLYDTKFTRRELEEADFGWVFDCEGVEVEEVQE